MKCYDLSYHVLILQTPDAEVPVDANIEERLGKEVSYETYPLLSQDREDNL
jgi:hypothetical protein